MSIVRFGVVGTNVISDSFLAASKKVSEFKLSAVYSRTQARATEFATKHGCALTFTDLEEMAECADLDAVYIASPTSLHASQSLKFLARKKHVLCEKPACSNLRELEEVLSCAAANNVIFLEAMRPVFCPNFAAVSAKLPSLGPVHSVLGTFCQLSSRWGLFLKGERPNAFLAEFSNGALMDLGCYAVHTMVALFGLPASTHYTPVMLDTGVDASGTLVMRYPDDKVVTLVLSKQCQSFMGSEIQGERATLGIQNLGDFNEVSSQAKGAAKEAVGAVQEENGMVYELDAVCRMIRDTDYKSAATYNNWSRQALAVMDQARASAGIVFPADQNSFAGGGTKDVEPSDAKKPKLATTAER